MAKSRKGKPYVVTCNPVVRTGMFCSIGTWDVNRDKDRDTETKCCARCGKSLTDPETGASLIAVKFGLATSGYSDLSEEFLRKQFGAYLPLGQNHVEYDVCWECWMKSFGIKPKG